MEGYTNREGTWQSADTDSEPHAVRRVAVRSVGDPAVAHMSAPLVLPGHETHEVPLPFDAEVKTLSFNVTEFFSAIEALPRHENHALYGEADMLVKSFLAVLAQYEAQASKGAGEATLGTLVRTLQALEKKLEAVVASAGLAVEEEHGVVVEVVPATTEPTVTERLGEAVVALEAEVSALMAALSPMAPEQVYLRRLVTTDLPELRRLSSDGSVLASAYTQFTEKRDRIQSVVRYLRTRDAVHVEYATVVPRVQVEAGALRQLAAVLEASVPAASAVASELKDIEATLAWLREPTPSIDWSVATLHPLDGVQQDVERLEVDLKNVAERLATAAVTLEALIVPEALPALTAALEAYQGTQTPEAALLVATLKDRFVAPHAPNEEPKEVPARSHEVLRAEWLVAKGQYESAEQEFADALTAYHASWQGKGLALAGKFGFRAELPPAVAAKKTHVQALAVAYEQAARSLRTDRRGEESVSEKALARYERLFARQLVMRRVALTVDAQTKWFAAESPIAAKGQQVLVRMRTHKQLVRYGGAAVLGMLTGGTAAALFGVGRTAVGGALMGALTNAGVLDTVSRTVGGAAVETVEAELDVTIAALQSELVAAGAVPLEAERLLEIEDTLVTLMRKLDSAKRARVMRVLGVLMVAATVSGAAAAEMLDTAFGSMVVTAPVDTTEQSPVVQSATPPVVETTPPASLTAPTEEYYGVRLVDPVPEEVSEAPFSRLATSVPADAGVELPRTPAVSEVVPQATPEMLHTVRVEVRPGDTFTALWQRFTTELESGLSAEEEAAHFASWFEKIKTDALWQEKIGITSGNIDNIFVGDTVDFTQLVDAMAVTVEPVAASTVVTAEAGDTLTTLVREAAADTLAPLDAASQAAAVAEAVAVVAADTATMEAVGITSGDVNVIHAGETYDLAPAVAAVVEAASESPLTPAEFHDWQLPIMSSAVSGDVARIGVALEYAKDQAPLLQTHEAAVQAALERALQPLMTSSIETAFGASEQAAAVAAINEVVGAPVLTGIALTEVVGSDPVPPAPAAVAAEASVDEGMFLAARVEREEAEAAMGGAEAFTKAYTGWLDTMRLLPEKESLFERFFTSTPQSVNLLELFGDEPVERLQAIANLAPEERAAELESLRLDRTSFETVQRLLIDMRNEGLLLPAEMAEQSLNEVLERYFSSVVATVRQ